MYLRCVCMSLSFALCVYVSVICAVCVCLYDLRCVCMSPAGPLLLVCVVWVYVSIICAVCVCLYNLRCVCMSLALPDWFDPRGILSVASVCPRLVRPQRDIFLQVWVHFPPLVRFQCVITKKLGHDWLRCHLWENPIKSNVFWVIPAHHSRGLPGKARYTHVVSGFHQQKLLSLNMLFFTA